MTMSGHSVQPVWRQMELPLTSSAAAFPASPTASPDSATAAPTSATSGPNSPASFARLGPAGSWLRMCQGYCQLNLGGSLEEYCETWPAQGTMRNGSAYPLPTWGRRIFGSGSGLWGTPLSVNRSRTPETMEKCLSFRERSGRTSVPLYLEEQVRLWPTPTVDGNYNKAGLSAKSGDGLATAVQVWPTPAARDYRHPNALPYSERGGGTKGEQLPNAVGGALNPTFVEYLMGLPKDWTKLD